MSQKRKILFISHVLDYSGAPRSLYYLLKYFPQRKNYEFWVLGLRRSSFLGEFQKVADKVEVITPHPPQSLFGKALERIFSLPHIYHFLRKARPQLVIVNSAANSRAIVLSRLLGYKTWVYVHEFDAGFVFLPRIRRKALLLADKILVTNRLQQKWVQQEVGFRGSIKIIPNLLPSQPIETFSVKEDFVFFVKKYPFLVATIGYFSRLKGWDILLDIMELLKEDTSIGFVLIGDFPRKDEKKLFTKLLFKKDLSNRVYITGLVPNVWPYIKQVHCVIITSRSETFSRAAMEAMACGIPVVAFKVGSLSEVFPPSYPYLVPPFENKLFVEKIKEIKNMTLPEKQKIHQMFKQHIKQFSPLRITSLFARELEEFFGS